MNTSLVKNILDWTEDKFTEIQNDIVNETNEIKHPYLKSFGLGAIEGAIDSLVVGGALTVIAGTIIKVTSKKK